MCTWCAAGQNMILHQNMPLDRQSGRKPPFAMVGNEERLLYKHGLLSDIGQVKIGDDLHRGIFIECSHAPSV